MPRLKMISDLWHHHRVVFIALVLAIATIAFFAIRLIMFSLYWADPAHRFQPIEGWMTIGYIARSYDIPRDQIGQIFGPNIDPKQKVPIEIIARSQGRNLDEFITTLQGQLDHLRD